MKETCLLSLKEFCAYMNIKQTKGRELLRSSNCTYSIRIGNRLYAHKELLDDYLRRCAKYNINIE